MSSTWKVKSWGESKAIFFFFLFKLTMSGGIESCEEEREKDRSRDFFSFSCFLIWVGHSISYFENVNSIFLKTNFTLFSWFGFLGILSLSRNCVSQHQWLRYPGGSDGSILLRICWNCDNYDLVIYMGFESKNILVYFIFYFYFGSQADPRTPALDLQNNLDFVFSANAQVD